MARRLRMPKPMGVVISEVVPGSPANSVGLVANDIILRVGNTDVNNPSQFSSLISDVIKTGTVLFLVYDHQSGRIGYVQVPLD
jgi:S1-C subfamily serine protease